MIIPRYWSKKTMNVTGHPDIKKISCWGYSQTSREDAEKMAEEKAAKASDRISKGAFPDRYLYSDRPMREEIIEEKRNPDDSISYVITRNAYGALVLNSPGVMFMDIDQTEAKFLEKLMSLVGMGSSEPHSKIFSRINAWLAQKPSWGMRLYETFKGYRVIVTHDTFDPKDRETLSGLRQLGTDDLYIKLCSVQECFRARLSPKPWRIGLNVPPVRFPREKEKDISFFSSWIKEYDRLSADFSVCRLIGFYGNKNFDREAEMITEIHDRLCKVGSALPLA